jgi:hypothetical protein
LVSSSYDIATIRLRGFILAKYLSMNLPNFLLPRGLFWKTNRSSGKSFIINPLLYTILVVIVVLPERWECAQGISSRGTPDFNLEH